MSNQEELISQFTDITGISEDRAKFYLESANWTLQLALTSYYEGEQENVIGEILDSDDDNLPTDPSPGSVLHSAPKDKDSNKSKAQSKSNVVTLHSMNKSSSEDEEEQGQAFYAGGSERSGQQVLGPPKRNPIKDYVSEVFRSAQASGAEVVEPNQHGHGSSSGSDLFAGTGYRLGQTNDDHMVLPSARPNRPQNIEAVKLKLWRQGFSINDGDLRPYEDAANKEFLQAVTRGEIPAELRQMGGGTVNVDLEDHRHEEFKKSTKRNITFTGQGHTLGSPAPNLADEAPPTLGFASSGDVASSNEDNERRANEQLHLDTNQPTTMLQVRLADGSRLSTRFNHSHTVNDIRQFITTARPQYAAQAFNLLTTFPSKELTDGAATIQSAGLLNAAIMQRLK